MIPVCRLNGIPINIGKVDILGNDQPEFIDRLVGKGLLKRSKIVRVDVSKIDTGCISQLVVVRNLCF